MSDRRPSAVRTVVGAAIAVGSFLLMFVLALTAFGLLEIVPVSMGRAIIPVFLLVAVGAPLLVAATIFRLLKRKGWFSWLAAVRRPRWFERALIVAYVLTVAFGLPAVQTHTNVWAVAEYKRLKASGDSRVWESHPYIATYLAVPVLPGLVLAYHEYQLDGLYGFGGFQLFAWYGVGVRELWALPL